MVSHRERVTSALMNSRSNLLPVISVNQAVTADTMKLVGISWPAAHMKAGGMADLALAAQKHLGFENVRVPFDQTVEAEAFGCGIKYGSEIEFPEVSSNPFPDISDFRVSPGAISKGRIPVVLDAISRLKRNPECEVPIISGLVGSFSVVAQIFGLEKWLVWTVRHPENVTRILDEITPFLVSYAKEQIRSGADIISVEDMAVSPDLLNPRFFEAKVFPYLKTLIDSIDVPVILHICGKTDKILKKMVELRPAAITLDAKPDLAMAKQAAGSTVKIAGNISPVTTLLSGTPEDVRHAVTQAVQGGVNFVAPGCSLSPLTPAANVQAMTKVAGELEARLGRGAIA